MVGPEQSGILLVRCGVVTEARHVGRHICGARWPEQVVIEADIELTLRAIHCARRTGLPIRFCHRSSRTGDLFAVWAVALAGRSILAHGYVLDDSLRRVRIVRLPPAWHPTGDLDMPPAWTEVQPPEWHDMNWARSFNAASRAQHGRLWALVETHLHPTTPAAPEIPAKLHPSGAAGGKRRPR